MFKETELFQTVLQEEEKSPFTISKYTRDAEGFLAFLAGRELTKAEAVAYKEKLMGEGYAVGSVNSVISSLNRFFEFLSRQDCRLKLLRTQRKPYCPDDKALTRAEYSRLLDAAGKGSRLFLVLETICSTGIRVSELKYFTVENVTAGEVTVECKNKFRPVLVSAALKKKILAYAKAKKITSGPVFITSGGKPLNRSNIWAEMKRLCKKADVEPSKVFPHNLRKLFARCFYRKEKDIAMLADILGHSNINTTRIYILTPLSEHRRLIEQLDLVL